MNYPTTEQVSERLQSYARAVAPIVAFVIALAVQTYYYGLWFGRTLYGAADWLAHNWPTRPRDAVATVAAVIGRQQCETLVLRVRALRAQGLSQRAIAAQCGISRATVRRKLAMA